MIAKRFHEFFFTRFRDSLTYYFARERAEKIQTGQIKFAKVQCTQIEIVQI